MQKVYLGSLTPIPFLLVQTSDHITGATSLTPSVAISKNGAAFGAAAGVVAELASGWYKLTPTSADTGTIGVLAMHCSGAGADPTDLAVQIVGADPSASGVIVSTNNDKTGYALTQSFPSNFSSLLINGSGQITIGAVAAAASNLKKAGSLNGFPFVMTDNTTHAPKTGLTVQPLRSLDGAAFATCAAAVAEVANGWYKIDLSAVDTSANTIALRFTATSADDQDITIITQP